ncbi:Hypothetical protein MOVI_7300 [Mesomycoplasma ovipneumoniae 14811]|uniref:Uncharacterized protein n=1 Tax=Mesomycoplasma ovipneumoniae 14811 TaxID=1188239 RepID=A0A014M1F5_9BACT|nr:Hypothetical protein MOVI_7300 [Mesomycoplasma ovipneumoniae 14811]
MPVNLNQDTFLRLSHWTVKLGNIINSDRLANACLNFILIN